YEGSTDESGLGGGGDLINVGLDIALGGAGGASGLTNNLPGGNALNSVTGMTKNLPGGSKYYESKLPIFASSNNL
ncbi:jg14816, partial [Pararge aegeria aegeria]